MSEHSVDIEVDGITITPGGGEITGRVAESFRPVRAIVDDEEAKRLRSELLKFDGTGQPPVATVPTGAVKWIGPID